MAQHVARKDLKMLGQRYKAGEPVPIEKLDRETRARLIRHRTVVPDKVTVSTGRKGR
jgi:hypothetical protein